MRIGIDLGGSKIEGVALDDAGTMLCRQRCPTPRADYDATIEAIADLVFDIERETSRTGTVGVATPGAISAVTGNLKNSNSVCLNGMPLDRDLASALSRPVRIANDADCFALSEAIDGAAAGARSVFGVIIGTGTGGGIVIDGHLLGGPNRITGEWGHNPLPWPRSKEMPGPDCYCGLMGCIETYLSGPGFAADYRREVGEHLSAAEICTRAKQHETQAERCLQRYMDRMARALASVINILDPEVIVLGGGLSNVPELYSAVPGLWSAWVFSDRVDTVLRKACFGDSSGVRGAAWLWRIEPNNGS
jgi:fructokinase